MTVKHNIQTDLFCSNCFEEDNDLNKEVSQWWKAETMPLESKSKSNDPEFLLANKIVKTTCVRQTDGCLKLASLERQHKFTRQLVASLDSSESSCQQMTKET